MIPLLLALVASPAVCEADAPAPLSFEAAALGRPRDTCLRRELALQTAARATVESDDFYGHLGAAALLSGRWALDPELELFADLELLRWELVLSSLNADRLGLGPSSIGAAWRAQSGPSHTLTPFARLTLPTWTGGARGGRDLALELGAAARWQARDRLAVRGTVLVLGRATLGSLAGAEPGFAVVASAGLEWRIIGEPGRGLGLGLDLTAQAGLYDPLDHLAVSPVLRYAWSRLGLELGAAVPVLGEERALALVSLRASWRLD